MDDRSKVANGTGPDSLFQSALIERTRRATYSVIRNHNLAEHISSVALIGSLVRGDFVRGGSDIDILFTLNGGVVVTTDEFDRFVELSNKIERGFRKNMQLANTRVPKCPMLDFVRLPAEHLRFLASTPLTWQPYDYPYLANMFGLFGFDMAHWIILHGDDFRSKIPVVEWRYLIPTVAQAAIRRTRIPFNQSELKTWASNVIRLAQVAYGTPTLDKRIVMGNFDAYVPRFPLKSLAKPIWSWCSSESPNEMLSNETITEFGRELLDPLVRRTFLEQLN